MASINNDVLQSLVDFSQKASEISQEFSKKEGELSSAHRHKLQTLLLERQLLTDKDEEFWPRVLLGVNAATKEFLSAPIDQRAARAIKSLTVLAVEPKEEGGKRSRRVVIQLRNNIVMENSELFREVAHDGTTVACCGGVKWKAGVERSSQKSSFRFFDESEKDTDFLLDFLDAIDTVYQQPLGTLLAK